MAIAAATAIAVVMDMAVTVAVMPTADAVAMQDAVTQAAVWRAVTPVAA
jgi:hypothetical protein